MSNRINLDGFGIFGIVGGLISLGFAVYQTNKLSKTCDKLGMAIDDVEKKANIDVQEEIVNTAIEHAVQRKVDRTANEAINAIKADIHNSINTKVRKEIDAQYEKISEEVTERITEDVASISKTKLSDQVLPRVEKKLVEEGEVVISRVESDMRAKLNKSMDFIGATTDVIKNAAFGKFNNGGGRSINLNLD